MAAGATAVIVVAACGLVGCSGRANQASAPSKAQAGGGSRQAAGPSPAAGQNPTALVASEARQVISTATLEVEVRDINAAMTRAAQLAVDSGGFVAASHDSGRAEARRGRVTLKVQADGFDRLVSALVALGEVRSKQVGTEDVTDQVVDLEARLRAGRASADRLQQLIAKAATVTEVVGAEAELAKRTAEIEALEGRLRVLRDKVDLATVSVSFSPPRPSPSDDLPGFLAGLRGGGRALMVTAVVASAVFGALLPWLVPAVILALAARLGWRRWRRRHPPRSRVVLPPGGPQGQPPPARGPHVPPPPPPPAGENVATSVRTEEPEAGE